MIAPQKTPTVWKAGSLAEVAWSIWSNHGGGYIYRLCPKSKNPSEKCFQDNILTFASNLTTIRSPYNAFEEFSFTAKDVNQGTYPQGAAWRMNPIPACNCDIGYNCTATDNGIYTAYNSQGKGLFPCEFGYQFTPPWKEGFGYWGSGAHYRNRLYFTMVDQIKVPEAPGEYVLSWRWDVESSPQIWGNCADISIIL